MSRKLSQPLLVALLTFGLVGLAGLAPTLAQTKPLAFAVTGVAANDALNVRKRITDPGNITSSEVIGTIPAAARDVLATGTTQMIGAHRWYEVRHGNLLGWVNGRYLKPLFGDIPTVPDTGLFCGGTEPFWSVRISSGTATMSRPSLPEVAYKAAAGSPSSGDDGAKSFAFVAEGKPALTIAVKPQAWCKDGMSDLEYAYEATLTGLEGDSAPSRRGCCSLLR